MHLGSAGARLRELEIRRHRLAQVHVTGPMLGVDRGLRGSGDAPGGGSTVVEGGHGFHVEHVGGVVAEGEERGWGKNWGKKVRFPTPSG